MGSSLLGTGHTLGRKGGLEELLECGKLSGLRACICSQVRIIGGLGTQRHLIYRNDLRCISCHKSSKTSSCIWSMWYGCILLLLSRWLIHIKDSLRVHLHQHLGRILSLHYQAELCSSFANDMVIRISCISHNHTSRTIHDMDLIEWKYYLPSSWILRKMMYFLHFSCCLDIHPCILLDFLNFLILFDIS